MDLTIASRLIELNRQFYQTFGADFSATRGRIQPGVRRILDSLTGDESILDLGCGNGNFERELARRGHRAPVLGLDFSLPLLEAADFVPLEFPLVFAQADLTGTWGAVIREKMMSEKGFSHLITHHSSLVSTRFSLITSFATLHHIPNADLRLNFCCQAAEWLQPGGRFVLSNWQFLNSERLCARIQPWSLLGFSDVDVEPGDYLLDWRSGGQGLRYVHHFNEAELSALAEASGFRVAETFYSDGQGGRLGLYQVWASRN
jgi:SAM-dependent methyltransferase